MTEPTWKDPLLNWTPSELTRLHVPPQPTATYWLLAIERELMNRTWLGTGNTRFLLRDGELTPLPDPVNDALRGDADSLRSLIDAELARGREAVEVLRSVEWNGDVNDDGFCPMCTGGYKTHAHDCRLASLLTAPKS
jgi:hypothetical protein